MKKIIFIVLSIAFCLAFSGCGESATVSVSDDETVISASADTTETVSTEVVPEEREEEFSVSEDLLSVTLGKYEQDGNENNGKESLEWIVLDTKDNLALVVSRYIVDCQPYNEGYKGCTWENSSIRNWLNTDFYNTAFSQQEQERIVRSFVPDVNPDSATEEIPEEEQDNTVSGETETDVSTDTENENETEVVYGGEITVTGTEDSIFLLSDFEVLKYLFDDENVEGDEAYCKATEYAKQRGVWTMTAGLFDSKGYGEQGVSEDCIGAGWWWLRTGGQTETKALDVDSLGAVRENGHDVGECHDGVRPAMWIVLD